MLRVWGFTRSWVIFIYIIRECDVSLGAGEQERIGEWRVIGKGESSGVGIGLVGLRVIGDEGG